MKYQNIDFITISQKSEISDSRMIDYGFIENVDFIIISEKSENWINRMIEYGFVANSDFLVVSQKSETIDSTAIGGKLNV